MTDNDFTKDTNSDTDIESAGFSAMENVSVENVYEENNPEVSETNISENTDAETADVLVSGNPENAGGDYVPEAVADSDETENDNSSEKKDHSADLAGYRAYRRKNFLKKEEVSSVDNQSKSSDTKIKDKLLGNFVAYNIGLVVITIFDFFAMHLFTTKQSYFLSDKILGALGFDVLHFTNITYEQICLGLGYFVAFIAGGVILFILLKILNKLFSHFYMSKIGSAGPVIALGIFAVIFAVGFIVSYVSKDSLVIMSVYKWGAPAMAYLGGLIFYGASKLHVGIEY